MYVSPNFKTKKQLKEAVALGKVVEVFQPNDMFGKTRQVQDAVSMAVTIEGPHYPEPHRWYARVQTEKGKVVKVLS